MDTQATDHTHNWVFQEVSFMSSGALSAEFGCSTCGAIMYREVASYLYNISPPKVSPAEDGHYHCWHRDNYVLESFPPQYPARCCHCGLKRNFKQGEFIPSTITHGDMYLPSSQEVLLHAFRPIKSKDHY